MQKEILSNNSVTICGRIATDLVFSHEVYGEGFYKLEVDVERLSHAWDRLPVIISERLFDESNLSVGMYININGQIRSYNNYIEQSKKNKLILSIFARDIEVVDSSVVKNPNELYINGFICKPPIYRTTPFGREISDMLIAVNRSYNKSDYIPCISWGRNARFSSKLSVGDNIKIWGRIQSRSYQKKYDDGTVEDKIAYEVSVSKLELTDRQKDENQP